MKTFKHLSCFFAALLFLSLSSCSKEDDVSPSNKQINGDWVLDAIYESDQDVTSRYYDINKYVNSSYLWIDEDVADIEGPYFQCFIVGIFAEGSDANHNEGTWEVKNDILILDGYSGTLQARIRKLTADVLYLEINKAGSMLEYRFSK
jgi:hypothetical protein